MRNEDHIHLIKVEEEQTSCVSILLSIWEYQPQQPQQPHGSSPTKAGEVTSVSIVKHTSRAILFDQAIILVMKKAIYANQRCAC